MSLNETEATLSEEEFVSASKLQAAAAEVNLFDYIVALNRLRTLPHDDETSPRAVELSDACDREAGRIYALVASKNAEIERLRAEKAELERKLENAYYEAMGEDL